MGKATDGLSTLALETPGPENIDGRPSPREAPFPLCHCATRPGPAARYCYCYCHCCLPIAAPAPAPAPAATVAAPLRALSVDCRLSIAQLQVTGYQASCALRRAPRPPCRLRFGCCSRPVDRLVCWWTSRAAHRSDGRFVLRYACKLARRTARDFPCARQWPARQWPAKHNHLADSLLSRRLATNTMQTLAATRTS
jgi:hypothetical protein